MFYVICYYKPETDKSGKRKRGDRGQTIVSEHDTLEIARQAVEGITRDFGDRFESDPVIAQKVE